jgi:hypothetical protein
VWFHANVRAVWSVVVLTLLAQPVNPWLEEARLLSRELRFGEAIERLTVARTVPGLGDDQRREVLELLARCQLAEGRRADADASLTELLRAEPAFEFDRAQTSPKILDAFDAAKRALYPPDFVRLEVISAPAGRVALRLIDPWKLVREVRRLSRVDGAAWRDEACERDGARVGFPVAIATGSTLEWYAQAHGPADAVLFTLGAPDAPFAVHTARPEMIAQTLAPVRWQRPAGWSLVAAAVLAAAVGAALQVTGWNLRMAARDPSKAPGNFTDTALAAERTGQLETSAALGLFIGAGVASVGGGALLAW